MTDTKTTEPEILSALKAAERDLDATYRAIAMHGRVEISIGAFGRLREIRRVIAEAEAARV